MRIISKFRDYYDSIAHIYGGGDPKIVYVRGDIVEPHDIPGGCRWYDDVHFELKSELTEGHIFGLHRSSWNIDRTGKWADYTGSYLCVAGRMFLLLSRLGEQGSVFYKAVPGAEQFVDEYLRDRGRTQTASIRHQFDGTKEFPELVHICQQVKAPVFQFNFGWSQNGVKSFRVGGEVPNLGKLRLAKQYPAQMIYQDLSYFMGNAINGSPDLDPPVSIDDKCRLLQRGFDLKTSFRGK